MSKVKVLGFLITLLISNFASATLIGTWSKNTNDLILTLNGSIDTAGLGLSSGGYSYDYVIGRPNGYSEVIASPAGFSNTWAYLAGMGSWKLINAGFITSIIDTPDVLISGATDLSFMFGVNDASGNGYFGVDSRFVNGLISYDQSIIFSNFFGTGGNAGLKITDFNGFNLVRSGSTILVDSLPTTVKSVSEAPTALMFLMALIVVAMRRSTHN